MAYLLILVLTTFFPVLDPNSLVPKAAISEIGPLISHCLVSSAANISESQSFISPESNSYLFIQGLSGKQVAAFSVHTLRMLDLEVTTSFSFCPGFLKTAKPEALPSSALGSQKCHLHFT